MSPMNQTISATSSSTVDVADLPAHVRWTRAIGALLAILDDPNQTERVLEFSTLANAGRRGHHLERFFQHPVGKRLYAERRAIDPTTVDLDALAALPAGPPGPAYPPFMPRQGHPPRSRAGAGCP